MQAAAPNGEPNEEPNGDPCVAVNVAVAPNGEPTVEVNVAPNVEPNVAPNVAPDAVAAAPPNPVSPTLATPPNPPLLPPASSMLMARLYTETQQFGHFRAGIEALGSQHGAVRFLTFDETAFNFVVYNSEGVYAGCYVLPPGSVRGGAPVSANEVRAYVGSSELCEDFTCSIRRVEREKALLHPDPGSKAGAATAAAEGDGKKVNSVV